MIRKLHHSAYRCRNSEETRRFYEDFLGLPLAATFTFSHTKTGRPTRTLHTLYRMGDGSYLAFFETVGAHFDFKAQHDFDLHIALEVDAHALPAMLEKGAKHGLETRGITDHGFLESIYLRDPNGYVIELCARKAGHDARLDPAVNGAREELDRWTAATAPASAITPALQRFARVPG